jgi:hypothetical protein
VLFANKNVGTVCVCIGCVVFALVLFGRTCCGVGDVNGLVFRYVLAVSSVIARLDGAQRGLLERLHGHSADADRGGGGGQHAEQGACLYVFIICAVLYLGAPVQCGIVIFRLLRLML